MAICLVCQGPHRTAVDDALSTGVSVRKVAAQFGMAKSSVDRHRSGCLAPKIAAAARLTRPGKEVRQDVDRAKAIVAGAVAPNYDDILSRDALLGRMARSLERLEASADIASAASLHVPLAAVSGQLHRGIETSAKIQGYYAEPKSDSEARFSISINLPGPAAGAPAMRDVTPRAGPEPFTLTLGLAPAKS